MLARATTYRGSRITSDLVPAVVHIAVAPRLYGQYRRRRVLLRAALRAFASGAPGLGARSLCLLPKSGARCSSLRSAVRRLTPILEGPECHRDEKPGHCRSSEDHRRWPRHRRQPNRHAKRRERQATETRASRVVGRLRTTIVLLHE